MSALVEAPIAPERRSGRKPTCVCGTCDKCKNRAAKQRWQARSRAGLVVKKNHCLGCGVPCGTHERCKSCARARFFGRQDHAAHASTAPVAWSEDLTALRLAVGNGACVGVFEGGRVFVDRVAQDRLVFADIDTALDYFTTPTRAE